MSAILQFFSYPNIPFLIFFFGSIALGLFVMVPLGLRKQREALKKSAAIEEAIIAAGLRVWTARDGEPPNLFGGLQRVETLKAYIGRLSGVDVVVFVGKRFMRDRDRNRGRVSYVTYFAFWVKRDARPEAIASIVPAGPDDYEAPRIVEVAQFADLTGVVWVVEWTLESVRSTLERMQALLWFGERGR